MKKLISVYPIFFPIAFLVILSALVASATQVRDTWQTRVHVEMLASDLFEGRLTGSIGAQRAAGYIVEELKKFGAQPLPGHSDFRIPFEFTGSVEDDGSSLTFHTTSDNARYRWDTTDSIQALSLSDTATVTGPVVFVGYGLLVPETDGFSYDSFASVDVSDKIVLMLRYFPEDADLATRRQLSRYAALRYKAFSARQRGAKGIIMVAGPRSPNAGELIPMGADASVSSSGIVAASITNDVAEAIFEYVPDKTLEEIQELLDSGNPHIAGFDIPNLELTLDIKVHRERRTGHNVVGYLPPKLELEAIAKPYVVIGAHYDHLGRGRDGGSLARQDEVDQIHYGADDNASGVAAVLVAGAHLSQVPRGRGIVLAFWSGEEVGLLGSAEFVQQEPVPMDQIAAYVNFDMVGRMRENELTVQAVGTSMVWTDLVQKTNDEFGFELTLLADPYLPTDIMSLNQADIPSLGFFTGSHEEYHRPSDTPSTLNYEGLDGIAQFAVRVVNEVANMIDPPSFIRVDRAAQTLGRVSTRVFTGTIPDYTTEIEGLRLSGVIGDGPADRAGLREGDVIIEVADQKITNIYDYMFAINLLQVDRPVKVIFLRDGEQQEVFLTPQARD